MLLLPYGHCCCICLTFLARRIIPGTSKRSRSRYSFGYSFIITIACYCHYHKYYSCDGCSSFASRIVLSFPLIPHSAIDCVLWVLRVLSPTHTTIAAHHGSWIVLFLLRVACVAGDVVVASQIQKLLHYRSSSRVYGCYSYSCSYWSFERGY